MTATAASNATTKTEVSTNQQLDVPQIDTIELLLQYFLTNPGKLEIHDYVHEELGRRFEIVNGQHLLAHMSSQNFTQIAASAPQYKDLAQFESYDMPKFQTVINTWIERDYLKRVIPTMINKKKINKTQKKTCVFANDDPSVQCYDNDGLYALLIKPPASSWPLIKALMIIGAIFAVLLHKVWPIIMKIVLWWLLLFTTIFLTALIILHGLSGVLFTILGKRGWYFMPNLFDEEISFFETFTPMFGYGGEHQERWALERELQLRARLRLMQLSMEKQTTTENGKTDKGKKAAAFGEAESPDDHTSIKDADGNEVFSTKDQLKLQRMLDENTEKIKKLTKHIPKQNTTTSQQAQADDDNNNTTLNNNEFDLPQQNPFLDWKAGAIGVGILFLIGGVLAWNANLFSPDTVPEFLVNPNEMRYYYPSLAATANPDFDVDINNGNVQETVYEEISGEVGSN